LIWSDVRLSYPHQWLVIEALEAHTTVDNQRQLDRIAAIETCADGNTAMQAYRRLHKEYPLHDFYFVHTDREQLDIRERPWLGIRGSRSEVIAK
jgi:hypothetical protein